MWVLEKRMNGEWFPSEYFDGDECDRLVVCHVKKEDAEKHLKNLLLAWPHLEVRIREYMAVDDIDW